MADERIPGGIYIDVSDSDGCRDSGIAERALNSLLVGGKLDIDPTLLLRRRGGVSELTLRLILLIYMNERCSNG